MTSSLGLRRKIERATEHQAPEGSHGIPCRKARDGPRASLDFIDLYEIPDVAAFVSEDLTAPILRKDTEEFGGFADQPEYVLPAQSQAATRSYNFRFGNAGVGEVIGSGA
jgi:hypothetical protein